MDAKRRVMRNIALFLLILLSLLMQEQGAAGAGPYLGAAYLTCMRNTTSLSSTFTRNLNTTLLNLTSLSSQGTKYAITTAGSSGQEMVYAMFQCRGDQSLQFCWECMQNATARLPQSDCPHSVGARIQLDSCYLRYDNQSFFVLDTTYVIGYCYAPTSDPVALAAIEDLMGNVTSLAPKQGGFASASASGEYAVAQCLGYLNESECSQCLLRYSYRTVCDSTLGEQLHLTSCYYRYEPYSFFDAPSPPPAASPPPSLAPSSAPSLPPPNSQGSKTFITTGSKTLIIVAGVVVGVVIVVGALCATLVRRYKASKVKGGPRVDKSASWSGQLPQTKAQVFSLEELEEATGHFHPSNKLGEGGFGIVYKGVLLNGERVAIKKLSIGSQQGKQEFLNEVNLITSVQHKNLIRLLGCCVEGPERILVYEYLPNKGLDFFLFGEARDNRTLNWSTRYGIVSGLAKGLAYLHEESHIRIVHRDIKPSNILLNDQLNPVIADFGLARLVKDNATHVNTRVAGTVGYLAPEYAMRGDLSEKVDVFSFGLVSLEILTGKQNSYTSLLTWVWEMYSHERTLDLVDEKLGNVFFPEQVIRVVHVALLCTQENPKQRPAMSMVTLWLSGMSDILEMPLKPTFLDYNNSIASMNESSQLFTSASFTSSPRAQRSRIAGGVQSMSEIVDPR